jgi:hypothetical protein
MIVKMLVQASAEKPFYQVLVVDAELARVSGRRCRGTLMSGGQTNDVRPFALALVAKLVARGCDK